MEEGFVYEITRGDSSSAFISTSAASHRDELQLGEELLELPWTFLRERSSVRVRFYKTVRERTKRSTQPHTHTYLPGLVETADSCCVKTHDDGKCGV